MLVGVLLLLGTAVALLSIVSRELPASADPDLIKERFAGQLDCLRELALKHPTVDLLPSRLHLPRSSNAARENGKGASSEEMTKTILVAFDRMESWRRKLEDCTPLFDDPAILEASVMIRHTERSTTRVIVKDNRLPDESLIQSLLNPLTEKRRRIGSDRSSVVGWSAGQRLLLRYEELFEDDEGQTRGLRLVLDADLVEKIPSCLDRAAPIDAPCVDY